MSTLDASDKKAADAAAADKADQDAKPAMNETRSETEHTVEIGGQSVRYRAVAGTLLLKDDKEKVKASVFYVAYLKLDEDDPSARPITFSFNGGPGSSSVWMHLGMLGPRRVLSGDVDSLLPPPHRLADNEFSLLDKSDLVFIDPVSTGFSRPGPDEDPKQFHTVEADVESVGDFIRLFVSRYDRWLSPKFLIGESYGTTRAAGLAGYLQDRHGLYLNGLMLISSILNFQTARFTVGNDLPYVLFLPTYTATAWYHGKLSPELQADRRRALSEVESFAATEYTLALMRGAKLSQEARAATVEKLARYTGLSPAFIERANLRITIYRFVKELLRDQGRTVGRIDSRFTGADRDAAGELFEYDPSMAVTLGAYSAALNAYVRRELEYASDLPYEILANLYENWGYDKHQNQFLNVAETLRSAMNKNRFLKVFVANGYYDLATPYYATEYTFNHLGIDAELQRNISMAYYDAGHMMYIHEPSLARLKQDLAGFVDATLGAV